MAERVLLALAMAKQWAAQQRLGYLEPGPSTVGRPSGQTPPWLLPPLECWLGAGGVPQGIGVVVGEG